MSLFKIFSRLYRSLNILRPYPEWVVIEPTNICNLSCPACPTGSKRMNRVKRMMSFVEFKNIIDQIKGHVKSISLYNFGEPFLNKELLSMIRYAKRCGMHITTSTNGEFFTSRQFCLELVKTGLDHLIISLDGTDQEALDKYRKGSNFHNIIEGIKLISESKKELGLNAPKIELQFMLMKHNEFQRDSMKQYADRLGVDVYSEKTMGIGNFMHSSEFQKVAKELLPDNLSFSRYFLKHDGTYALKGEVCNRCWYVYKATVINSDGTVVPCCWDSNSEHVMGNVSRDSLKDIWLGERYQDFRKQFRLNRKKISICQTCPIDRRFLKCKKAYYPIKNVRGSKITDKRPILGIARKIT